MYFLVSGGEWYNTRVVINGFVVNAVYIRPIYSLFRHCNMSDTEVHGAPPGMPNTGPVFEPRAPNQGASCASRLGVVTEVQAPSRTQHY